MITLTNFIECVESLRDDRDRLGHLYVNINSYIWDELLGEKYPGYDDMTYQQKHEIIGPYFTFVERELSEEETSMYWWLFGLNETYAEWHKWYYDPNNVHLDHNFKHYRMINNERVYL